MKDDVKDKNRPGNKHRDKERTETTNVGRTGNKSRTKRGHTLKNTSGKVRDKRGKKIRSRENSRDKNKGSEIRSE